MLIIVQNSQITGIEKELLNTLNIDLISVSNFINTLNLQLSSLQNTPLNINNQNFSVKEIEILSTDNIKIFDLNIAENTPSQHSTVFENHQFETSQTLEDTETLIKFSPEEKEVSFEEPVINLTNEENNEDLLIIPQEKQKEENNTLNINILNEPSPEITSLKEAEEKPINFEEEPQEPDIPLSQIETSLLKQSPSGNDTLSQEPVNLINEENNEDLLTIPQEKQEENFQPHIDLKSVIKPEITPIKEQEEKNPELQSPQFEELLKQHSSENDTSSQEPVNLINEENGENTLIVPQEKQKEKDSMLDMNTLNEPLYQKEETEIPDIQLVQDDMIEISFEDDLEEIRNILNMNKEEFGKTITSELQKASQELGIDYKDLMNWYEELIQQIKDEKSNIYNNINEKNYNNLHKSYHKLKGAALNLRISKIAIILKKLDELSKNKENIEKIRKITDDFYNLIENESNLKNKHIEDIILITIQNYLNTQNEAQFQKDKKHIEKLLQTKINSIKDLQKYIKELQ